MRRPTSLVDRLFGRLIRVGLLEVIDAQGVLHRFGPGGSPQVTLRLTRPLPRRALVEPSLVLGEAYMDGHLLFERGTLLNCLEILFRSEMEDPPARSWLRRLIDQLLRRIQQHNDATRARANVAHHYDLSPALYDLFLDADRQYSCAYFPTGSETLEQAQAAKKHHLAAKLLLEPGQEVLEIGSGWGGLALTLAREAGVCVTGITLSTEQLDWSRARAQREGLADRVTFELRDYRDLDRPFDRIISVGMFEHVGIGQFDAYFAQVRRLLKPDGIALVHAIGRMTPPAGTNAWIRKYIFPGGYTPSLSEVLAAVERQGLWSCDVEILRLHYARTLHEWATRFAARRDSAQALYDERFCRMWELYLAASEANFRWGDTMVWQLQLARTRDAVPLTRDYITEWERRHPPVLAAE